MIKFMGIEYGRGCLATAIDGGPALATREIKKMFPDSNWITVTADPFDATECARDRFGENYKIQVKIYNGTPAEKHIMIGGDHSVNFGHFAALADQIPNQDLCLIYIDAHFDIHTPESAAAEASGAPHGTNVRAALGAGDSRWLALPKKHPVLKPENLFFLGARSYEPAEFSFVIENNIFWRNSGQLQTTEQWDAAISEIRGRIGGRPFAVSFDFDAIDPKTFTEVLVPAPDGISLDAAEYFIKEFQDAYGFEFVEYAPNGGTQSADIIKKLIKLIS
ncbi:MAG: arginase family protein [Rickettsiales bacterium]|jgi:arginase family enzyme|nr:arginase family protein [Rickettsiales bacterium]